MAASFEQLLDENLSTVIMKQGSLVTGIVIDILDKPRSGARRIEI